MAVIALQRAGSGIFIQALCFVDKLQFFEGRCGGIVKHFAHVELQNLFFLLGVFFAAVQRLVEEHFAAARDENEIGVLLGDDGAGFASVSVKNGDVHIEFARCIFGQGDTDVLLVDVSLPFLDMVGRAVAEHFKPVGRLADDGA